MGDVGAHYGATTMRWMMDGWARARAGDRRRRDGFEVRAMRAMRVCVCVRACA